MFYVLLKKKVVHTLTIKNEKLKTQSGYGEIERIECDKTKRSESAAALSKIEITNQFRPYPNIGNDECIAFLVFSSYSIFFIVCWSNVRRAVWTVISGMKTSLNKLK